MEAAFYRFSVDTIGRGQGRSAVAASAYRNGVKLDDQRLGLTQDYSRKTGVSHRAILAPADAPDWIHDRERLWNEVERAETRINSRLARDFEITIPDGLDHAASVALIEGFVRDELVSRGMIVDVAIHEYGRPCHEGDERNWGRVQQLLERGAPVIGRHDPAPDTEHVRRWTDKNGTETYQASQRHAHGLAADRTVGPNGFGEKNREWNAKATLLDLRKAWANHANRALASAGIDARVDHRKLADQVLGTEETLTAADLPAAHAAALRDVADAHREIAKLEAEERLAARLPAAKTSLRNAKLNRPDSGRIAPLINQMKRANEPPEIRKSRETVHEQRLNQPGSNPLKTMLNQMKEVNSDVKRIEPKRAAASAADSRNDAGNQPGIRPGTGSDRQPDRSAHGASGPAGRRWEAGPDHRTPGGDSQKSGHVVGEERRHGEEDRGAGKAAPAAPDDQRIAASRTGAAVAGGSGGRWPGPGDTGRAAVGAVRQADAGSTEPGRAAASRTGSAGADQTNRTGTVRPAGGETGRAPRAGASTGETGRTGTVRTATSSAGAATAAPRTTETARRPMTRIHDGSGTVIETTPVIVIDKPANQATQGPTKVSETAPTRVERLAEVRQELAKIDDRRTEIVQEVAKLQERQTSLSTLIKIGNDPRKMDTEIEEIRQAAIVKHFGGHINAAADRKVRAAETRTNSAIKLGQWKEEHWTTRVADVISGKNTGAKLEKQAAADEREAETAEKDHGRIQRRAADSTQVTGAVQAYQNRIKAAPGQRRSLGQQIDTLNAEKDVLNKRFENLEAEELRLDPAKRQELERQQEQNSAIRPGSPGSTGNSGKR